METSRDDSGTQEGNVSGVVVTQDANAVLANISILVEGEGRLRGLDVTKCDHRSCKNVRTPCEQLLCAGSNECRKKLHWDCYKEYILEKNGVEHFTNSCKVIACTKKHYLLAKKKNDYMEVKDGSRSIPWHLDGKEGADDPNNSMRILIDWLTTPGNFNRYKGDNKMGKTKVRICEDISRRISAAGCRKERTAVAINSKIHEIVGKYRKASDWASQTGQGVLAEDGELSFNDAVSDNTCLCKNIEVLYSPLCM